MPLSFGSDGTPGSRQYRWVASSLLLFALVLALVGGATLFSRARNAELAARDQAALTGSILDALGDVLEMTLNAETGQRGYLLTADQRYLDVYKEGVAGVPQVFQSLKVRLGPTATSDQQQAMNQLESLLEEKIAVMRETVELKSNGHHEQAMAIINRDSGARLMTGIRKIVTELAEREQAVFETEIRRAEEAERWAQLGFYGLGAAGAFLFMFGVWLSRRALAMEAATRQAEMHRVLAIELNHRIRNLFAIVGAIVSLSARGAQSAEEAAARARERIMALGRAHEASQNMLGSAMVDLRRLVEIILQPYEAETQLSLSGPTTALTASAITPLGLLLHEWATNAAKYGALSGESGRLNVEWQVEDDGALLFTWSETGGPVLGGEPEYAGFGSRLADQSAAQLEAELTTEWKPQGVVHTLRLPESALHPEHQLTA